MADRLFNGIAVPTDWDPSKGDYKPKEPGYEERINIAKKEEKKTYTGVLITIALMALPVALLVLKLISKIKL